MLEFLKILLPNKKIAIDLDGTILDSRDRHKKVLDYILYKKSLNINTTSLLNYKRKCRSTMDYLVNQGIDKETTEQIVNEWVSLIEANEFLKLDKLYNYYNNIKKLFLGNELYLITARKNSDSLHIQLQDLNIINDFKEIYVVSPKKNVAKEKAKILLDQQIGLFIGDTKSDFHAATIANIPFIHLNLGFNSYDEVFKEWQKSC